MSARNDEVETLQKQVNDLTDLVSKLTQPGATPPDRRVVLRIGPPFFPAGQGGYVFDPEGQLTGPVVGPVIILT